MPQEKDLTGVAVLVNRTLNPSRMAEVHWRPSGMSNPWTGYRGQEVSCSSPAISTPFTPRIARVVPLPGMWYRYVLDMGN